MYGDPWVAKHKYPSPHLPSVSGLFDDAYEWYDALTLAICTDANG